MSTFRGFQPHDFDAYAPNKWRSNVYNLERMQAKEKLLALARDVSPVQPGAEVPPLAIESSLEHPGLWNGNEVKEQAVYFLRAEDERKELFSRISRAKSMTSMLADPSPFREHIHLAITLRQQGVSVSICMHPDASVDRENTARKVADGWQLQTLVQRLSELPTAFQLVLVDGDATAPDAVDGDALRAAFTANAPSLPPGKVAAPVFTVRKEYDREDAELAAPEFAARARQDLEALLPLYEFLSWTRQNDFVSVKEAIKEEKRTKKARGIGKDDQVRVTRGLFSGKTGVVLDIDAKGGLKVRIGTMVVKLDAKDVATR